MAGVGPRIRPSTQPTRVYSQTQTFFHQTLASGHERIRLHYSRRRNSIQLKVFAKKWRAPQGKVHYEMSVPSGPMPSINTSVCLSVVGGVGFTARGGGELEDGWKLTRAFREC